jgi:hypothetical protein
MIMPNLNVDSDLTANERREAVAAILARGVLRHHRRIGRLGSGPGETSPDFSHEGLEVLGETRLSVSERAEG